MHFLRDVSCSFQALVRISFHLIIYDSRHLFLNREELRLSMVILWLDPCPCRGNVDIKAIPDLLNAGRKNIVIHSRWNMNTSNQFKAWSLKTCVYTIQINNICNGWMTQAEVYSHAEINQCLMKREAVCKFLISSYWDAVFRFVYL